MGEDCDAASSSHTFLSLVSDVPLVRSTLAKTSSAYNSAKEGNVFTKIGFGTVEMSLKTALATTKFAYRLVPSCGVFRSLKEGVDKKVEQVDSLACYGLQCVQKRCPIIMEDTDKVVASGTEKLEASVVVEAALVISEAIMDYIRPEKAIDKDEATEKENKLNGNSNAVIAPCPQTKLHRVKRVFHKARVALEQTVVGGGKKFLGFAVSAPVVVTKTGFHGVKTVLAWTWDTINVGQRRRSCRRNKRTIDYHRILATVNTPFPVGSLDKKRKRNPENPEEATVYEMLYVDENYVSDEDPDFNPEDADDVSDDDTSTWEEGSELEEGDLNDVSCESEANSSQVPNESQPEKCEPVASADPAAAVPREGNEELKGRVVL